jgi:Na+/H+-dicarboxylate symporter
MARVAWIGKLFLDALKMLVVPLLFAAVVTGVAPWGTCGGSGGWAASRSSISS